MAQIRDFRLQTAGLPTTPGAGVVGLYANASGALLSLDSNGVSRWVGGQASGSFTDLQVATGGIATLWTGAVFGGAGAMRTGLSNPTQWIPILTADNRILAIPAYALR